MQAVLDTIEDYLELPTPDKKLVCRRLVRLIRSQPGLVAAGVISDNELSGIEGRNEWEVIWTVSTNEDIEFHYPAAGPSFSSIVLENISKGVTYRYLAPATERAFERARLLTQKHPKLEIRFMDDVYYERHIYMLDEVVIYEAKPSADPGHRAFYLFPGSTPRRWIEADSASVANRLEDVKHAWDFAKKGKGA